MKMFAEWFDGVSEPLLSDIAFTADTVKRVR